MGQSQVIFLTGVGRSGTTMLQSMLAAHSAIHFPPETHFFKRYILPYLLKRRLPQKEALTQDPYLKRLDEELRTAILNRRYDGLKDLREALLLIMGNDRFTVVGDKDTEYVRYLPHLKILFPRAILLHITRDPRDVVLSRTKTEWGSKRSVAFHAAEYQYYIQEMCALGPRLFEERYLELRYEDLLQDPAAELQGILKSLHLPFEGEMLNFHLKSKGLVAQDEASWKQNLSKPVMRNNVGKWREGMSETEAALVQRGIEDFMQDHQYPLVDGQANLLGRLEKRLVRNLFRLKTIKERIRNQDD